MFSDSSWKVRDIRTGRAIGKTRDPMDLLLRQLSDLTAKGIPHYFAIGSIKHSDMFDSIKLLREHGFTVVRDRQLPPDVLFLLDGFPEDLGFSASA